MTRAVVFGATGYAGGLIADELARRGHAVIRANRSGDAGVRADLLDPASVAAATQDADVAVVAIPASRDGVPVLPEALRNLLEQAPPHLRLAVVGGAGSLLASEDGPRLFDTPDFPPPYLPEARAHWEGLQVLQADESGRDWFYVSPTAAFGAHAPAVAPRGSYRLGTDVLLVAQDGSSAIAGEDYALAFVDEIEQANHHRQRFAVGY